MNHRVLSLSLNESTYAFRYVESAARRFSTDIEELEARLKLAISVGYIQNRLIDSPTRKPLLERLNKTCLYPARMTRPCRSSSFERPPEPEVRTDYHSAALWLKGAAGVFDVAKRPWLRDVVNAYASWTRIMNGSGLDEEDELESPPGEWSVAYFKLLAYCLPSLTSAQIDEIALMPIMDAEERGFHEITATFLPDVDILYFNELTLKEEQAIGSTMEWNATVGAETNDFGRQGLAFLPDEIWIHAGDSITSTAEATEPHTVTFLTDGQIRPPFNVGCPGFSTGSAVFDGSICITSALLFERCEAYRHLSSSRQFQTGLPGPPPAVP